MEIVQLFTKVFTTRTSTLAVGPGTLLYQLGHDAFLWGLAWGLGWIWWVCFAQVLKNQNFHIGCGPGTLLFQVGPDAFFWGLAWGLCWKLCRFLHICFETKTSTLAVDLAPNFSNLALRPSFGAWSGAWVGNCATFTQLFRNQNFYIGFGAWHLTFPIWA